MLWKPIDTAPKTGTHILLHFPEIIDNNKQVWYCDNKGGWVEGWWCLEYKDWRILQLPDHGCRHCCVLDGPGPDAWMPLPEILVADLGINNQLVMDVI